MRSEYGQREWCRRPLVKKIFQQEKTRPSKGLHYINTPLICGTNPSLHRSMSLTFKLKVNHILKCHVVLHICVVSLMTPVLSISALIRVCKEPTLMLYILYSQIAEVPLSF